MHLCSLTNCSIGQGEMTRTRCRQGRQTRQVTVTSGWGRRGREGRNGLDSGCCQGG